MGSIFLIVLTPVRDKRFLAGMNIKQFRVMLILLMVISGVVMIVQNVMILF